MGASPVTDGFATAVGRQVQLACAWSGIALLVIALGGMSLAGILPVPPAAYETPAQVVAFYTAHPVRIRIGLTLACVGVSLIGPLTALITLQMLRMERHRPPILSILQAICAAVTWVMLLVPFIVLNVATFRPDRNPEITQALTDLGFLLFLTPVGPFLIQNFAIGGAVLSDRASPPVMSRWVGYANFLVGLLFVPALLAVFFKTGPFAWHGVFVFYIGVVVYGAWVLLMSLTTRAAIHHAGAVAH
jgi:hypothetical protein